MAQMPAKAICGEEQDRSSILFISTVYSLQPFSSSAAWNQVGDPSPHPTSCFSLPDLQNFFWGGGADG